MRALSHTPPLLLVNGQWICGFRRGLDERQVALVMRGEEGREFPPDHKDEMMTEDEVERGASFVVERHGHEVCRITQPQVQPRLASECLALLRNRSPVRLDHGFGADLQQILDAEPIEPAAWDS